MLLQLVASSVLQTVDLGHGGPPLAEGAPAALGLAPDVEVGVDEHHDGPDRAAALEDQDPAAVEEEEDCEAELDGVAERPDVVDTVVEGLPEPSWQWASHIRGRTPSLSPEPAVHCHCSTLSLQYTVTAVHCHCHQNLKQ